MGFGVWGLGFGVWGLGFGVWGLGFGVWGLGFGVWGLGIQVLGFSSLLKNPPQKKIAFIRKSPLFSWGGGVLRQTVGFWVEG